MNAWYKYRYFCGICKMLFGCWLLAISLSEQPPTSNFALPTSDFGLQTPQSTQSFTEFSYKYETQNFGLPSSVFQLPTALFPFPSFLAPFSSPLSSSTELTKKIFSFSTKNCIFTKNLHLC